MIIKGASIEETKAVLNVTLEDNEKKKLAEAHEVFNIILNIMRLYHGNILVDINGKVVIDDDIEDLNTLTHWLSTTTIKAIEKE